MTDVRMAARALAAAGLISATISATVTAAAQGDPADDLIYANSFEGFELLGGSIEGRAFFDPDSDGDLVDGQPLAGVEVYLDENYNGRFDGGEPLDLTAWARDRDAHPVTVRFYRQRGAGDVVFAADEIDVDGPDGAARTTATFSEPGEYVVYVRADHTERSVREAGLEQCCWSNGYVSVTVLPQ